MHVLEDLLDTVPEAGSDAFELLPPEQQHVAVQTALGQRPARRALALSRAAAGEKAPPPDAATHGGDGIMRGRVPYAELERMQPVEMDVEMLQRYIVPGGRVKRE